MMIRFIIDELRIFDKRYKTDFMSKYENILIAYLIYLKYLCDNGEYKYEEVIDNKSLYELNKDIVYLKRFFVRDFKDEMLYINRLLIRIKDVDIKTLLIEFLKYIDKAIYFHDNDDKICYINFNLNFYNCYNDKGNATYIYNKPYEANYKIFKAFDDILGVKNEYVLYNNDVKIKNYDYVYVLDDIPKYRIGTHNIFEDIFPYIVNNGNVVLYTNYNKISNFNNGRRFYKCIKKVILNDNKAYILFNRDTSNKEISIINYNDKIEDAVKLYNIIKNNRKQKDVLVKISYQDLVDNNMRIGFKLYQIEKPNKIRNINKIVDENTRYLKRLNIINDIVEQEINILLNK